MSTDSFALTRKRTNSNLAVGFTSLSPSKGTNSQQSNDIKLTTDEINFAISPPTHLKDEPWSTTYGPGGTGNGWRLFNSGGNSESSFDFPQLLLGTAGGYLGGRIISSAGKVVFLSLVGAIILVKVGQHYGIVLVDYKYLEEKSNSILCGTQSEGIEDCTHPVVKAIKSKKYFVYGLIGGVALSLLW